MTFGANEGLATFTYYFEQHNKRLIAEGKEPVSFFKFLFGKEA